MVFDPPHQGHSDILTMMADSAVNYRQCLFGRKEQHLKMNVIRSHCHEIYTEEINKIALSFDDHKRIIIAHGMHTLAYSQTNFKKF